MSWADLLRVTAANKHRIRRSKYRNLETVVDGHAFDSRREATRYRELRLLERAGEIAGLELQPAYVLHAPVLNAAGELVGLKAIGKYIADFKYREVASGLDIVEDSKGVRTPVYRLKKKIIAIEYGIQIRET
jgi:hypothetical protein